jgi:hypothetical protein
MTNIENLSRLLGQGRDLRRELDTLMLASLGLGQVISQNFIALEQLRTTADGRVKSVAPAARKSAVVGAR